MFYSICNWGNDDVWDWAGEIANSWRTTKFLELYKTTTNTWQAVKSNFLFNQLHAKKAHPNVGWNDPDMLQIGNGVLTHNEEQSHFAMWAFAKAPLIISSDLT